MLASVTDGRYPTNRPDQIPEWFSNRGYTITVSVEDGTFWATLVNGFTGSVSPGYGRGRTALEALEGAKQKYQRALMRNRPGGNTLP